MERLVQYIEEQGGKLDIGQILMDTKGKIIDITSPFKTLTGYDSNVFIGKKISYLLSKIVKSSEWQKIKTECKKLVEGNYLPQLSISMIRKDGEVVPMLLSASILRGVQRREPHKILLLRELTELQKRCKMEFYKDLLAHDMANILNNIKFSAQLLEMCLRRPTKNGKRAELMDVITQQVDRGISLLSSVRKLSTIKEKDNIIMELDLVRTLERAIESIRSRFRDNKLEINTELPLERGTVKAGELLRDAFENIMLNGCIHNKSEMLKLWIKVSKISELLRESKVSNAREGADKLIKIEFKDNGTGIPMDRKEAIFKRNHKQGRDGAQVSLGLWLVRNIIEEYNGHLRVEDRVHGDPTSGSNFIVYLREA